jgi:hypothetical protein
MDTHILSGLFQINNRSAAIFRPFARDALPEPPSQKREMAETAVNAMNNDVILGSRGAGNAAGD